MVERKADPVRVDNTAEGSGRHVVQAGTIIGDIYLPPERRARGLWYASAGLLVGVVLVLVTLRVLPDSAANDASEPDPVPTTSSTTPTDAPVTATSTAVTRTTPAATPTVVPVAQKETTATPAPLPDNTTTTTTTTTEPRTSSGSPTSGGWLPY